VEQWLELGHHVGLDRPPDTVHGKHFEFAVVGVVGIREEDQVVAGLQALLDDFADLRDRGITARGSEVALFAKAIEDVDHDGDVGHG
jgi:hypothetical protein